MPEISDNLLRHYQACKDALRVLVVLKAIKDRDGKTADYMERQPKAWAAARDALGVTTTARYSAEDQATYCANYCAEGNHHIACALQWRDPRA